MKIYNSCQACENPAKQFKYFTFHTFIGIIQTAILRNISGNDHFPVNYELGI